MWEPVLSCPVQSIVVISGRILPHVWSNICRQGLISLCKLPGCTAGLTSNKYCKGHIIKSQNQSHFFSLCSCPGTLDDLGPQSDCGSAWYLRNQLKLLVDAKSTPGTSGRHELIILQRERERFTTSIQPAWLMRTGLRSCLSLLQQGNETTADRLLVLVPHEHTHAHNLPPTVAIVLSSSLRRKHKT